MPVWENLMRGSMKHAFLFFGCVALSAGLIGYPWSSAKAASVDDAVDAYLYGLSLVIMDMTRKQTTNVASAGLTRAPMGQLVRMRTFPTAEYRDVPGANTDTLYTMVWLDVSQEPWIFSIPDMGDRYYMMPMLDGWTNVFQSPGTRTTGQKAQKYAITGPGWSGTLPKGVTEYKSPTGLVWILGRIYCTGTPEDYAKAHVLQDKVSAHLLRQAVHPAARQGGWRPEYQNSDSCPGSSAERQRLFQLPCKAPEDKSACSAGCFDRRAYG
jgi:hypothetical protein